MKLLKSKIRSLSGLGERTVGLEGTRIREFATSPETKGGGARVEAVPESRTKTRSTHARPPTVQREYFPVQDTHISQDRDHPEARPKSSYNPQLLTTTSKYEVFAASEDTDALIQCGICNRTFRPDVLERHTSVCAKLNGGNRPKFDSKSHRLAGMQAGGKPVLSDFRGASSVSQQPSQPKTSNNFEDKVICKRPSWRDKSDQLRAAIGAARSTDPRERLRFEQELARVNQQCLTKCEYCGRSFNAEAAARHIPICRNKAQMMPKKVSARPIEKTVAEVTSKVLGRAPLVASNREKLDASRRVRIS